MPEPAPPTLAALQRFARAWRSRVDAPARKAAIAVAVSSLFALAHLARLGTTSARIAAGALMIGVVAAIIARWITSRRGWQNPRWVVEETLVATDPDLGQRTLRAMRLVDRSARDRSVGSEELARAYLEKTLAHANPEAVSKKASSVARLLSQIALVAGALGLATIVAGPFRVIEGLDVLLARHGVSPMPFQWLDEPMMLAHPPKYLHQRDVSPDDLTRAALPYGSLLTVRGVPLHAGRKLVLVDGTTEVPFVDDATGGVVARWPLTSSARLRVAARFGAVLIPEPETINVTSIPDESPVVTLEGAPKTVKLLDTPEIEISYDATDDHGLREVHLVLRCAGREDRRELARLDGETTHDRGGHRLRASDPFLKRSYAPIEITVEARDNDPLRGPKWGKSEAITVVPPVAGEPEAMRYEALARARDAFVDLMAFRIENEIGDLDPGQLRSHALREKEETDRAISELERTLSGSYGGLSLPRRVKTLAKGQVRKLRELLDREVRRTGKETHAANRALSENFSLALDGLLRRLDAIDAATIAKRLADVADDAAEGAAEARRAANREHGVARLDVGSGVLDGGGGSLMRLGSLGHDLGEIVANDLKRARRTRGAQDFFHTELALRDLAARLRHPAPSFSGGMRRGGVEAGGSGQDGDPSDGADQIAREQELLEELTRDHGTQVSGVEQAMSAAEAGEELDKLREEARQHAQAVRDAVRMLPRSGGEPGSADSAAAAAREHAEAMADELERGGLADAVKSGRNSESALEQAQRAPVDRFSFRRNIGEDAKTANGRLDPEVRWAERALDRLKDAASSRAAEDLRKTSPREGELADRARSIAKQGSSGAGALPGEALDLLQGAEEAMRDGARSLGAAEGDRALQRLKEAQRLLEMARSGGEPDEGEEHGEGGQGNGGERDGDSRSFAHRAPIPKAKDYKGPDAFRHRVLEGLGSEADPRLKDAVKRYAEGLLR